MGWCEGREEEREREGRGGGGRGWERTGNAERGVVPRGRLEGGRREDVWEGGAGRGREGEEEAEGGVLAICRGENTADTYTMAVELQHCLDMIEC